MTSRFDSIDVMFGPGDPGYSVETIRAYQTHPAQWYDCRDQAASLLRHALDCVATGTIDGSLRARHAVDRAIQLYEATGLTRDRAVEQAIAFWRTPSVPDPGRAR